MTKSDDGNVSQLHKAYQAKTVEALSESYDRWAGEYETHMKNVGYAHPAMVTSMLVRHLPAGAQPILDAGAGTGIMGVLLTAMGYAEIIGFDASNDMMAAARAKKVYADLEQMFLGCPLSYPDNHFAAVTASGVFTEGHAPLSGLDELVRVTRPGGLLVFSLGPVYLGEAFEKKSETLESTGIWHLVDASKPYNSTPLADALICQVFVYRKDDA
ncbi:MAG: methyltransferase domain-containing protein [Gammaproteobacteria bacterium]|nr:methyltransferase domain-containing protein [Gammaproteobacteria bacterium]